MIWTQVALAYLLDLVIGDPINILHPVVLIGKLISFLENRLYKYGQTKLSMRLLGLFVVLVTVAIPTALTFLIVNTVYKINSTAGLIISVILISTTIATKSLMKAGREIAKTLNEGDIEAAKNKVAMIVGRDTEKMKRKDVVRATIESVAENSVDGVIAPLFYALVGGAPLAMAYRAINTLDSMLGYKNEKYQDFGWAAARLDDLANLIPARLSAIILAIAAFVYGRNPFKALKSAFVYAKNHASPNSGWPEAAIAGACDIRLGGTNYYGGIARRTEFIGNGKGALTAKQIEDAVLLMFIASAVMLLLAKAFMYLYHVLRMLF